MISGTRPLISQLLIIAVLLCGFANAWAEELYQWKDPDGTITYSTTPPSASITTNYQEISKKLAKSFITPVGPNTRSPIVSVAQAPKKLVAKKESRLERLVRLSPAPMPSVEPAIRDPILQPVNPDKIRKTRKCRDLNNRVGALEARLSTVSSAQELNESMLLLTRYQNSFDKHCQ